MARSRAKIVGSMFLTVITDGSVPIILKYKSSAPLLPALSTAVIVMTWLPADNDGKVYGELAAVAISSPSSMMATWSVEESLSVVENSMALARAASETILAEVIVGGEVSIATR